MTAAHDDYRVAICVAKIMKDLERGVIWTEEPHPGNPRITIYRLVDGERTHGDVWCEQQSFSGDTTCYAHVENEHKGFDNLEDAMVWVREKAKK